MKGFIKWPKRWRQRKESVVRLPLELIFPNPFQPRRRFDGAGLKRLAASIQRHGVIQPVLVTESEEGHYRCVAGERRVRAAKLAGLSEIPAIVRPLTPRQMLEIALLENVQREDLNVQEAAESLERLRDEFDLEDPGEIGKSLGENEDRVADQMAFLKLPMLLQRAVVQSVITEHQAVLLARLPREAHQLRALEFIHSRRLDDEQVGRLCELVQHEAKLGEQLDMCLSILRQLEQSLNGLGLAAQVAVEERTPEQMVFRLTIRLKAPAP